MKFICFALVGGVGATSASCDTPDDDILSALQYGVKVKEQGNPMHAADGDSTTEPCTTCQGQDHNMELTAPDRDGEWRCLDYWPGQDNDWCKATSVHEGFEMKFNDGDHSLTPGCGRCWCCTLGGVVPGPPAPAASLPPVFAGVVEHSDWQCHDYATELGNDEWCSGSPMNGPFQIRFTAGDDSLAPGCGDCWCCKRDTREKCPDWFGNIQACGDRELKPMGTGFSTCSGFGELSCTAEHLADKCDKVELACCVDEDGSCTDNDYSFACLLSAVAPTPNPTMTKPSPTPTPPAEVSVAPAWMQQAPLCGDSELMKTDNGGTMACEASGCGGDKCPTWVRPCTETVTISWCTEWGRGPCCSDEDGDCTNDSYHFSCLKK